MSDFVLISPEPAKFGDTALALLAIAGADRAHDVRTTSDGVYGMGFLVPADLHEVWIVLITSGDMPPEDTADGEVRTKRPYNRKPKPVTDVPAAELEPELALNGEPTDD